MLLHDILTAQGGDQKEFYSVRGIDLCETPETSPK